MQNKCLRMILDAPWRTRITGLHDESQIEAMEEFLNRLAENFHASNVANLN